MDLYDFRLSKNMTQRLMAKTLGITERGYQHMEKSNKLRKTEMQRMLKAFTEYFTIHRDIYNDLMKLKRLLSTRDKFIDEMILKVRVRDGD